MIFKRLYRGIIPLILFTAIIHPSPVYSAVFVTASISASTSNVPFQTYESRYGSGSLGFDMGRFIRLQYTHSQEFSISEGFKDPASQPTPNRSVEEANTCESCIASKASTHVIGNSLDLQIILYDGALFMPYVTGGAIVKLYKFENLEAGQIIRNEGGMGPVPNLGAGLGLRLNKDFTLKLSYIASPGLAQTKGEEMPHGVWDKKVTLGLSYQI